jgi:hypothetical protein
VHRVAADCLAMYYVFPSGVGAAKKMAVIREVASWKLEGERGDFELLDRAFAAEGIGHPGTHYHTAQPWMVAFYIKFAELAKSQSLDSRDPGAVKRIADAAVEQVPESCEEARHIMLHLMFPAAFERIASGKQKMRIVKAFAEHAGGARDPDDALANIRSVLQKETGLDAFDFYKPEVKARWSPEKPPGIVAPPPPAVPAAGGPGKVRDETKAPYAAPPGAYTLTRATADLFLDADVIVRMRDVLLRKRNIVLEGPPGVGKSFVARRLAYLLLGAADDRRIEYVQFHQSYAYEDFIVGWRPKGDGGFALQKGLFYRFCLRAAESSDPHVFIIDEINRGNLSKIFGELLMLVESDKRGPGFAVPHAYSAGTSDDNGCDERLFVPENVYLIGMMNTADRSLALVDYALRRRFAFLRLEPAFHSPGFQAALAQAGASPEFVSRLVAKLDALNAIIQSDKNLGRGYEVGHSYFTPLKGDRATDEWFRRVVDSEVAPLLREYWFDNSTRAEESIEGLLQ